MPRSKLAALANYRSLNTGTLGLRNTQPGRALMAEWLAVAADGVVECHPHDQAALQLLLLWKLNGSSVERAPFGYRCRKPRHKLCTGFSGSGFTAARLGAFLPQSGHSLSSTAGSSERRQWSRIWAGNMQRQTAAARMIMEAPTKANSPGALSPVAHAAPLTIIDAPPPREASLRVVVA